MKPRIIDKLERKFGKYAIPHLTRYILFTYILSYLIMLISPNVIQFLMLDVNQIMEGQVWRIISWLLVPPSLTWSIWILLMLWVFFSLGTQLERTWGDFKYNIFIFGGLLATVIGAFILHFVFLWVYGPTFLALHSAIYSVAFTTYYISLSTFLGFALTYPETQFLALFFFPIKAKYMALIYAIYLGFLALQGNWQLRVVIICSLLNVIVFFLSTRNLKRVSPKEIHRKQVYRAQTRQPANVTKHKCAVCGRTEKDGDFLEFRFCSKCTGGNYEYCQDHLWTHEHIK